MHIDIAVLGQITLLFAGLVALIYWQWSEYTAAKKIAICRLVPGLDDEETNESSGGTDMSSAGDSTPAVSPTADQPVSTPSADVSAEAPVVAGETPSRRLRLRDLGVRPGVLPCGPKNAITDVGVLVGHTTLISGDGALMPGQGPVRTGVTVILPHGGDLWNERASAGSFVLNGNGSVTGLDWIQESGLLEGPIALTNTHSVGDVYSGLIRWMVRKHPDIGIDDDTYIPVVGECDDSPLNDIQGMHVRPEHAIAALDAAAGGPVTEGAVGAGTGMTCYDFKGGIGTASRLVTIDGVTYTVGVLVNCNHGNREQLKMIGVPIGRLLEDEEKATRHVEGSIVIVVATDVPLSCRQLNRVAKRAAMGLALTGSTANNSSGDFVVAFSNGRLVGRPGDSVKMLPELPDGSITPVFEATVEATEEAILNCLCAADTVVGRDNNISPALPLVRVRELLHEHAKHAVIG